MSHGVKRAQSRRSLPRSGGTALAIGAAALMFAAPALAAGECKFKPQRPPVIKSMGPCVYDPATQSYAGDPVQQAACLTNPVMKIGRLGPPREVFPPELAERVGRSAGLPNRDFIGTILQERGLESVFGPALH